MQQESVTVRAGARSSFAAERSRRLSRRQASILAGTAVLTVVGWSVAAVFSERAVFAVFSPAAAHGVEAASALARVFGALVLFLFLSDEYGRRLRWVAAGLLVVGLGGLVFGYAASVVGSGLPETGEASLASFFVNGLAGALFAAGLLPAKKAPPFSNRTLCAVLLLFCAGASVIVFSAHFDPHPLPVPSPSLHTGPPGRMLTGPPGGAYLWLSLLPLVLAATAAVGAVRLGARGALPGWLAAALVLFAGCQLHNIFWPSIYGQVVTTADLLRLAFALVVAAGGIYELWRVSSERARLLAEKEGYAKRLEELSVMKADFTAMVAHELANPLCAVRGYSEMLALGDFCEVERARLLESLQAEADGLEALIEDLRASATIEREGLTVDLRPVLVRALLVDVSAFARTLAGGQPLTVTDETSGAVVVADPHRIGQVLRNLVSNAAKYSPEGAPIRLRAVGSGAGEDVRFEIADRGAGILPDDVSRIFRKFCRGRDAEVRKVSGVGLGLYVSRRIVECHGANLVYHPDPSGGSVFSFELRRVRPGDGHLASSKDDAVGDLSGAR